MVSQFPILLQYLSFYFFYFFSLRLLTSSFLDVVCKQWLSAPQVFSSIDRITQNSVEDKDDSEDKTKSTTLPSTETLSWSSEYSEMYVRSLPRALINSVCWGSASETHVQSSHSGSSQATPTTWIPSVSPACADTGYHVVRTIALDIH